MGRAAIDPVIDDHPPLNIGAGMTTDEGAVQIGRRPDIRCVDDQRIANAAANVARAISSDCGVTVKATR